MSEPYKLVLMPSAVKALETKLKPSAAFALYEFMDSVLCAEPRRVGKPLVKPFDGYLSARRGAYRMICRIEDADHTVRVLTVGRRADVYRPR
ncbi:MAG: type II toxin-antitoxin system RelE/ParE family toxin [Propionibacteriaceae bacterium]|nr:type II toxin-antitoxin system RelE/ParE family toxin [Propionibacteriaceae bacterium]